MAEAGWPHHVVAVGRFEFRRTWRDLWANKRRLALRLLGVAFPSFLLVVGTLVAAGGLRTGTVALTATLRGSVALFWLLGAATVASRVASTRPRPDGEAMLLTTVSARTAALGLLVAESLRALSYVALPLLALTASMVVVLGSTSSLVLVPLAGGLFAVTAVAAGSVVGYAVDWLVAAVPTVARHRTSLGGLAALGFFGVFTLLAVDRGGVGQSLLAWFPTAWLADLAVLGSPVGGRPTLAVAGVAACLAWLLVGGVLVVRLTAARWFADPAVVAGDESPAEAGATRATTSTEVPAAGSERDGLARAIRPIAVPAFVDAPSRRVAEWALLRTRRDPRRLTFLLLPAVLVGQSVVNASLQGDNPWAVLAPAGAVVLPWLAGALVAMNPLGDEGPVLPVTLTAVTGRDFVRGLVVAGLVVGWPLALVVTAGLDVLAPYPVGQRLGLAVLAGYLTLVSVAIGPAIGLWLPRFSAIRVGQRRAVLPPRMTAVLVHLGLTVLPGGLLALLVVAPGVARALVAAVGGTLPAIALRAVGGPATPLAAVFDGVGLTVRSMGPLELRLVLGGLLVVGGLAAAVVAYRRAIRRFDGYDVTSGR